MNAHHNRAVANGATTAKTVYPRLRFMVLFMRPCTKAQIRREQAYRDQLKRCGFRSWKRANQRRAELIDQKIETGVEPQELVDLQRLADLYVKWKTNDAMGRQLRGLKSLEKRLGIA
jgi:hypothetical protein